MTAIQIGIIGCAMLLITGCGTPGWEAGYDDDRAYDAGDQPASLFEMQFGGGHAEVTKNIPGDAAKSVGTAVKSLRTKPDATWEEK